MTGTSRRPRIALSFACATLATLMLSLAPAAAQNRLQAMLRAGSVQEVSLPAGQSATIRVTRQVGDIRVADPEVADVVPLGPTSLYLLGKGAGRTTVSVYDGERDPIGIIEVEVGVDMHDLTATIERHAPEADVSVSTVNGRLRLGGTVNNAQTLETILGLARQYVGEQKLINAVKVLESQQVLLEVRFIEASRRAGREIGVNLGITDPSRAARGALTGDVGFNVDEETGTYVPGLRFPNGGRGEDSFRFPFTGAPAFATVVANVLSAGVDIDVFIRALENKGLGRSLAEPNLTALSGSTASFLAGGEFPIPVRGNDGEVTVVFREFGVRLAFTPTVMGDGLINLELKPEVSQLDRTINVDGVPGLLTRRTETTVELRDGQSFAISGLLQAITEKDTDQVPWLGSVPIIGALFRSSAFMRSETDLVVIVTPRLVQPAAPGELLRTPLDNSRSSNDVEFFLFGVLEVSEEDLETFANGANVPGPTGHIIDLRPQPEEVSYAAP